MSIAPSSFASHASGHSGAERPAKMEQRSERIGDVDLSVGVAVAAAEGIVLALLELHDLRRDVVLGIKLEVAAEVHRCADLP